MVSQRVFSVGQREWERPAMVVSFAVSDGEIMEYEPAMSPSEPASVDLPIEGRTFLSFLAA